MAGRVSPPRFFLYHATVSYRTSRLPVSWTVIVYYKDMNVLLLFTTNSGSTQAASDVVRNALTGAGHTVTVKNPKETTFDEVSGADLVVFASPSWDYEGKEGQPHEDFNALLKEFEGKTLEGKPFAIVGLGDTSYTHYCGAVDVLEEYVGKLNAKLAVPSLRIDRYYQNSDAPQAVKTWAENLNKSITS